MKLENFETDFCDGVLFCTLLWLSCEERVPKWNPNPRYRAQKLENAMIGLKVLQAWGGLRFIGIGPEDFVNGNVHAITTVLWTFLLRCPMSRYSITGVPLEEESLAWVRERLPHCQIPNFSAETWSDGQLWCHLLAAMYGSRALPKSYGNTPVERIARVCSDAQALGIPFTIEPSEMVSNPLCHIPYYVSKFMEYQDKHTADWKKAKLP